MEERLQKYMAHCGVASRRSSEILILDGRVKVNSHVIKELGFKVNPEQDIVEVDNKRIALEENKLYIALNKPIGYVSTVKDERGRSTILDLVKVNERIYPIGRLDYNSSGLLLMTNDGEIYNKIIHPRKKIGKIYIAVIRGIPSMEAIEKFKNGIDIGGYITQKAKFEILKKFRNGNTQVKVEITEGKNRQIRKMCKEIGHPVMELKRISIGDIKLNDLKEGNYRNLSSNEINYLKHL
ncbi:pseudouridine synthase [Clostridium sediminicola]|uniref:pseudouridine synthase n=1 Tax=Clostridium sediminicola TaxID=3114879 RepID=UPI0031F1E25A